MGTLTSKPYVTFLSTILFLAGHKVRGKNRKRNLSPTRLSSTGQKEPVRQMSARNLVHLFRLCCCCFLAIRLKVKVSLARRAERVQRHNLLSDIDRPVSSPASGREISTAEWWVGPWQHRSGEIRRWWTPGTPSVDVQPSPRLRGSASIHLLLPPEGQLTIGAK